MPIDPRIPAPSRFSDVRIVRFAMKGQRERLAGLCRDNLDGLLPEARYQPVDDTVVLALLWCAGARWNLGSSPILGDGAAWVRDDEDAPWQVHGDVGAWLHNADRAAWAQLAIGFRVRSSGDYGQQEQRFFCPFALAGSPWALIAERELLGYPTLLGRFTPANVGTAQRTVQVESYVYESPDRRPELRPVVSLELPAPLRNLWDQLPSQPASPVAFSVRGIQLRQFRDAVQVNAACHQDLVNIEYQLENLRTSTPAGPAEIRITDSASLRIWQLLGLDSRISVATGEWCVERCELQVSVIPESEREGSMTSPSAFASPKLSSSGDASKGRRAAYRRRSKNAAASAVEAVEISVVPPAQREQLRAVSASQADVLATVHARPYPRLATLKADVQVPPPYRFERMEILGFKLHANRERLETLCDELLNFDRRRGFDYCPATSEVILEVLKYPSMRSTAGALAQFAPDRQYEMLLRVLLGKMEEGAAVATDPRVFCPYILVSNPISMISGREVLGYPKLLGEFDFDGDSETDDLDVAIVTVRTQGYAPKQTDAGSSNGKGASSLKLQPLITIKCGKARKDEAFFPVSPERPWMWRRNDLDHQGLDRDHFVRRWMNRHTSGYGTVQVRQIRDIYHPERYTYLDVVEGEYGIENLEVILPSRPATIDLQDQRSLQICADLGLRSPIIVNPGSWYRARCDVRLRVPDPLA